MNTFSYCYVLLCINKNYAIARPILFNLRFQHLQRSLKHYCQQQKSMRKIFLPALILLLIACNKQPMPVTNVLLRIHNETNKSFTQVLTTNGGFNNVGPYATSDYQSFFYIRALPFCTLISATDTSYAGQIPVDNPDLITTGKYTLQIKQDTTTATGYSCLYKQE